MVRSKRKERKKITITKTKRPVLTRQSSLVLTDSSHCLSHFAYDSSYNELFIWIVVCPCPAEALIKDEEEIENTNIINFGWLYN